MTDIPDFNQRAPARRWLRFASGLAFVVMVAAGVFWFQSETKKSPSAKSAASIKTLPVPVNLPGIEPVDVPSIAPEEARKLNEEQPFVSLPPVPARPFRITGSPADIDRAVDCLASAIQYEAGSETLEGKKAVAQVVLNRVRHPAYPKSVCGVVFQGHERRTGCQFTYTCDGALNRQLSESGWSSARKLARSMLTGLVYAPVGWATHYHTDWVFPSWSSKLDKIHREGTHLFFRWRGFWGTPPAFRGRYAGIEANQSKLSRFSAVHFAEQTDVQLTSTDPITGLITASSEPIPLPTPLNLPPPPPSQRTFINPAGDYQMFVVNQRTNPDALLNLALQACGEQTYCKVLIWTNKKVVPSQLPVSDEALAQLSFSYLRNRSNGFEKSLWNCALFQKRSAAQCIKHQVSKPPPIQIAPAPQPQTPAGARQITGSASEATK